MHNTQNNVPPVVVCNPFRVCFLVLLFHLFPPAPPPITASCSAYLACEFMFIYHCRAAQGFIGSMKYENSTV
jgi:hypothetical protein